MIRNATSDDAGAISEIYNYYIQNTVVSFEQNPVSIDEMQARIATVHSFELPWLVYLGNNVIDGYAYATKWHSRPAYKYSVETSIYLRHTATGGGIGKILYKELLDIIKCKGYHAVIGGIALPNVASVALHEKFGFEKVAHYKETGFKFGQWIDVGYWELIIDKNTEERK